MLVTIIKSDVVTDTTIKTIETFAKIRKLSRNLNSISAEQINTGVRGFNI